VESNALTIYRPLTPDTWTMIQQIAPAMHSARLFGVASPEQAMAIMLKGHELGLGLASSFEFIQVVEGKPTISPRGALAMIMQSPLCAGVKIEDIQDDNGDPVACRVWMKRTNGMEYTVTWTMADAQRAGIIKSKGAWETYPANMLRWRAVGYCADIVFPDLIGGLKRADEFGADLTIQGDVIEGSWRDAPAPAKAAPVKSPAVIVEPAGVTLPDLVARFGAEKIMAANGGAIPGTDEEIAKVAEVLEGVRDAA
jgi:hypothetical protein